MSRVKMAARLSLIVSPLLYVAYALATGNTVPAVVMAAATLVFGFLGSLVAARRLFFLAGAAPHASLLAALASIPLVFAMEIPLELATAVLGLLLVYIVGYAIYRGTDPDTATSVFVSASASLSVILAYLVATRYPLSFDITAVVFGDPLLAVKSEAIQAIIAAVIIAALALATYRQQVYIGVDREAAALAGLNIRLYDLLFFTMLGIGVSILIRSVGFVLEHVLVLIPGAVAGYAPSSKDALIYAVSSSVLAGALGLFASEALNVAPAGVSGIILLSFYVIALLANKKGW